MTAALQPLQVTKEELSQLLMLIGTQRSELSPLPAEEPGDGATMRNQPSAALKDNGWLEENADLGLSGLSAAGKATLQALLQPKTSVQLVLGDLQEILITEMYSADGFHDDELVIFTERKAENRYVIRPGVSSAQVSDALLEHLMVGPRLEGLEFVSTLSSRAALIFFCVLDWIHTLRILSKLQNDRQTSFAFTSKALWQRAMEIQLGEDLMWMSALLPYLFPDLEFEVNEETIAEKLDELAGLGFLDRNQEGLYYPNDLMIALADALVPMLSFGSCAIRQMEEELTGFHLVFVVGVGTNLVLEAAPGKDGRTWLQLTAVSGIELSKLLFRIGFPEKEFGEESPVEKEAVPVREVVTPVKEEQPPMRMGKPQFCTKCGTPLRPGVKFCTKCGHHQVERGN